MYFIMDESALSVTGEKMEYAWACGCTNIMEIEFQKNPYVIYIGNPYYFKAKNVQK